MKECLQSSKDILQHLLHKVCGKGNNENVETLLKLGADPFSEDEQGMAAVTKAVLSNIEPRQKLSSFKNFYIDKVKKRLCKTVSFIRL